ncbi:MAG: AAA family ATPase [Acidimicrobiales bacterium]
METARSSPQAVPPAQVVTYLVVEWELPASAAVLSLVRDVVLTSGSLTPWPRSNRPGADTVAAAFRTTASAVRAALEISRASMREPDPLPRIAVCTVGDPASGGQARALATELLHQGQRGQTLVGATTAALASAWLPAHVDLVLRERRVAATHRPLEHIYELRHGATAGSNLGWAHRAVPRPLVGREDATAALESAWKETMHTGGRTAVVVGERATGKTALAALLAMRAHAEGALILHGRWDPQPRSPYQAIREALGAYAGVCPVPVLREDVEADLIPLVPLVPELGARLGSRRATSGSVHGPHHAALVEAVDAWLDRLAGRRPVLMVLDDLQWADPSSLRMVETLRHTGGPTPRMLVVTTRRPDIEPASRSPGLPALIHALAGDPDVALVELPGVDAAAALPTVGRSHLPSADAIGWRPHLG